MSETENASEVADGRSSDAFDNQPMLEYLRRLIPHLYVAPAFIVFALFVAFPVGFAVWLSFHEWNGLIPLSEASYIGLDNFRSLFHDEIFREAFVNTIVFASFSTFAQLCIAFVLAFSLWFYKLRFGGFFRAVYFFPTVLSMVMIGMIWRQMLSPGGLLDGAFNSHIDWLGQPNLVIWVVIWVATWQWSGWTMILLLAGMMAIPNELIEAARIDGAKNSAIARTIVVPLIQHAIGLALLLNVIGGFQVFDTIYVLTGGGPNHASEVLGTYSYWTAFGNYGPGQLGYAAAMATVMVSVLFVFSYTRIRMSRLV